MSVNTDKKIKKIGSNAPHEIPHSRDLRLEQIIGVEIRKSRKAMDMTIAELATLTGLSNGSISKIENGQMSLSLTTLQTLSKSLNVPVTKLMRGYDETKDITFVKSGGGLKIQRQGSRAGHIYNLLGHSLGQDLQMEPYIVTIEKHTDTFPAFQHDGMEFIYILEGIVDYRHGSEIIHLEPGDSIFFDATAQHGPEKIHHVPVKMISVISYLPR